MRLCLISSHRHVYDKIWEFFFFHFSAQWNSIAWVPGFVYVNMLRWMYMEFTKWIAYWVLSLIRSISNLIQLACPSLDKDISQMWQSIIIIIIYHLMVFSRFLNLIHFCRVTGHNLHIMLIYTYSRWQKNTLRIQIV